MGVINLTSDFSENENEFSNCDSEEMDEFPYKCQKCPEKFRQISEAQTHFFGAHQNSEKNNLEIKEEAIPENHGSENNISVIEMPEFSDSEEADEFPYKCQKCPEKFRQISEVQTHFFGAHQNSEYLVHDINFSVIPYFCLLVFGILVHLVA
jgi:predicted SprT family Zn-dependent metalloprotease